MSPFLRKVKTASGATAVQMSDDVTITSQKQMKEYLDKAIERREVGC